ncbi:FapA family protein [Alteromonas gracilis]|uniref:FapA family protein n=1 Tax=Alteromonas gracilis TaxID=1479524 RepID=UPI003735A24C
MNGVTISFDESRTYINLTLTPSEFSSEVDIREIRKQLESGETKRLYVSEKSLKSACDTANHYFKTGDSTVVQERIGERKNAEVEFRIPEDGMQANLVLTTPYGGKLPTLGAVTTLAQKNKVVRGLSTKVIESMLNAAKQSPPGTVLEQTVAKGLPARNGKNSKFIPLVPNALERVLKPQTGDGERVDMRNLGEVICVKVNTPVLRRTAPTKGRSGFDVKGNNMPAISGEWIDFKMGSGTVVSDSDANLLMSAISGMPKYRDQIMNIDDTFICSGVNVGSGHVNYEGAVLVNGDVTEKMQIKASGDVTINGFVESAYIESGGDIIITEGAMGKVNDAQGEFQCRLVAAGSIHVQHGQGIDIQCNGNITVGRQLAYSRLRCGGAVIVGQIDKPMGNLFACDIISQDRVEAGTLGAVSGSTLKVDFSPGFNQLLERKESLDELLRQIRENNLKHKEKINLIQSKKVPKELQKKVAEALELFNNESALLEWLENKANDVKAAKENYQSDIRLIANKRLYPGVSAKLNNRNWRSEREYDRACIRYESHQWHYDPLM